jgi:hypothetical protein
MQYSRHGQLGGKTIWPRIDANDISRRASEAMNATISVQFRMRQYFVRILIVI